MLRKIFVLIIIFYFSWVKNGMFFNLCIDTAISSIMGIIMGILTVVIVIQKIQFHTESVLNVPTVIKFPFQIIEQLFYMDDACTTLVCVLIVTITCLEWNVRETQREVSNIPHSDELEREHDILLIINY